MHQYSSAVFVAVNSFLLLTVSTDECPYKECNCEGGYIECLGIGLTTLPNLVNKNNTSFNVLQLSDNKITEILSGTLPSNLVEINFDFNPIVLVEIDAFKDSASTLQTLRFNAARFSRIPDAFLQLATLKQLFIYNTTIKDWNPDVMRSIAGTVETLYLDAVGLETWPSWMREFSKINDLYIAESTFTTIPDNGLESSVKSLATLICINGRLTSLSRALSNHTALKVLYLQYNQLSDTSWLPTVSNLSYLDVSHNNILDAGKLSQALRPLAHSLTSIDVADNRLTSIPDFSFLTNIHSLDFGRNQISDSNSGGVPPNLNSLSFGFNLLSSIPRVLQESNSVTGVFMINNLVVSLRGEDFPPTADFINFQNNLIAELTDDSFPENSTIRFLYLENNPLVKISLHAFDNLQGLQELYLSRNKLTRLPLALASLPHILILNMSNSSHLICTCAEKSLESWIRKIPEVLGNCGRTSVSDFYKVLSPGCPAV